MNSVQQRFLLFIFVCVGIRLLLVYVAKKLNDLKKLGLLKVMGGILLIPAIVFFYSYMNYKITDKGATGGNVWWNSLRLVHGFTYLLFVIMALSNNKKLYSNAWIVLLIDVGIGLLAFLIQYTKSKNLSKLLQ
jgi:hypothetical protein